MAAMRWKLVVCTLLSAVLFPLALPNEILLEGNAFLGLFCLSFMFWAIYESPSYRFAAVLGMIFGLVSTVLANYWLKNFNEYAIYTLGGTTLGYIGLNALLFCVIRGVARIRPGWRVFLTPMVWAVYEYLKSTGFLASPYTLIAYPPHTILPFIQFVDITGLWGLSFVCALFSSLVAEAFSLRFSWAPRDLSTVRLRRFSRLKYQALFSMALVVIAFAYGALRLGVGFASRRTITVELIQQNIDSWRGDRALAGLQSARDLTLRGLRQSQKTRHKPPDLVAWSETALRFPVNLSEEYPFRTLGRFYKDFDGLFQQFQTATLTGAPVVSPLPQRYYNAAVLVTKEGRITQMYAKQHPVPFVESIPFMDVGFIRDFFQNDLGLSNFWLMGDTTVVFTLSLADGGNVRFGAPICFEDMFPDICRDMVNHGAEVLVNVTNDSWSGMKSALTQHTAAARFRAIETRTPLVRSTNAGLTGLIAPSGEIVSELPLFKPGYLLVDVPVPVRSLPTLYAVCGDYLPYAFTFFILLILVYHAFESFWLKLKNAVFAALLRARKR